MDKLITQDIDHIVNHSNIDFSLLKGKNVFITGATGLIGRNLVFSLLKADGVSVTALVRNEEKAKALFGEHERLTLIKGDVMEPIKIDGAVDYIIHAANQTSSKAFVNEPVQTIHTAVFGTENMLTLAREKKVKMLVYLSSMEVYGAPQTDEKIGESHGTSLDTMAVRSCYPESKRLCESLCRSYTAQYGIPAVVVRLTQTFGPGVTYNDGRVFAEFARCAIEGKDIVLHTKGETKRNYLYTADSVTAILSAMLYGEPGRAYNAANEETYCSVYEMAEMVCRECADGKIGVQIVLEDESKFGFAPVLKMNLDTTALKSLGWSAKTSLPEMFRRLIESMKENR